MIECRWFPGCSTVARIARLRRRHVRRWLAGCLRSVVTRGARARRDAGVREQRRRPRRSAVTRAARRLRRNVAGALRCHREAAAGCMAGGAVPWRAAEQPLHVAGFAARALVGADQRKAGRDVIEAARNELRGGYDGKENAGDRERRAPQHPSAQDFGHSHRTPPGCPDFMHRRGRRYAGCAWTENGLFLLFQLVPEVRGIISRRAESSRTSCCCLALGRRQETTRAPERIAFQLSGAWQRSHCAPKEPPCTSSPRWHE